MRDYMIKRVLLIIPTVLIVTFLVFIVIRLIPGDIIDLMAAEMDFYSQLDRIALEKALGLDAPMHIQYFRWVGAVFLHGDLGNSLWSGTPVIDEIMVRLPVTLELTILSTIIASIAAVPLGIYSAIRQDTVGDYISRSVATTAIALPSFWVATLVVCFGSIWIGWSPPLRFITFASNPLGNLGQFILPAFILGMYGAGTDMRLTRSMMLEVMRQDYVRTAWAKGLRERVVVLRHALKNALIPVLTNMGLHVPTRIGGTVIIESIFGLPGVGRLIVEATTGRDYTIVSGVVLFLAFVVLAANLLVDLSYGYLDPRTRYQ